MRYSNGEQLQEDTPWDETLKDTAHELYQPGSHSGFLEWHEVHVHKVLLNWAERVEAGDWKVNADGVAGGIQKFVEADTLESWRKHQIPGLVRKRVFVRLSKLATSEESIDDIESMMKGVDEYGKDITIDFTNELGCGLESLKDKMFSHNANSMISLTRKLLTACAELDNQFAERFGFNISCDLWKDECLPKIFTRFNIKILYYPFSRVSIVRSRKTKSSITDKRTDQPCGFLLDCGH